jgi:hypothetical protein
MLYHIWIDAEHCMTVDDGNAETAGYAVSLQDGRIVATDNGSHEDEHGDTEDGMQDEAASLTDIDGFMTEIQEMLTRQRNAN